MSCGIDPTTLRALRDQHGLSQVQLASLADLAVATVTHLERGEIAKPRTATIFCLAGALRMDPPVLLDALCRGHDTGRPPRRVPPPMSPVDAGRKGGQATKARHGVEHFRAAGTKGGRLGGQTTRDRYGSEHYRRIGAIGGSHGKGRGKRHGRAGGP